MDGKLAAEVVEGPLLHPAHLHLREAQAPGDLALAQLREVAELNDSPQGLAQASHRLVRAHTAIHLFDGRASSPACWLPFVKMSNVSAFGTLSCCANAVPPVRRAKHDICQGCLESAVRRRARCQHHTGQAV